MRKRTVRAHKTETGRKTTTVSAEENRLILRLLAAVAAAEDRLCDSVSKPEEDDLVLMLRAAMLEAERSLPAAPHTKREILKA